MTIVKPSCQPKSSLKNNGWISPAMSLKIRNKTAKINESILVSSEALRQC
jgi:hypothetical protein